MHRFHIEPSSAMSLHVGGEVSLPQNASHQIRNVLRLHAGENIAIFTGDGREWTAQLEVIERDSPSVTVRLLEVAEPNVEMKTQVAMAMALTRPQRYELALAKCTELGASEFLPIITDRVLKSDSTISTNRMARWNRIVKEAAELSGRVCVPQIADPQPMNSVLERLRDEGTTQYCCGKVHANRCWPIFSRHYAMSLTRPSNLHSYSVRLAGSHSTKRSAQPKLARSSRVLETEFSEPKPRR